MSLAVMVPTRGRPENAVRLAKAARETAGAELAQLHFLTDTGEPLWDEYQTLLGRDAPWVYLSQVSAVPQRIGPILNWVAPSLADRFTHVGFMGDDHLPRTQRWDEELVRALNGRPGVAYANDLLRGADLPTMAVVSSDLVRGLGFFAPPGLEHLYLDDFWALLGRSVGNLVYRDDVIVEHLHPEAGKSAWDDGYARANDPEQYRRDHAAYDRFLAADWSACEIRMKEYLSG